jgi:hypothetical protein
MADQVERIERNVSGEAPPPVALRLRFESPTNPEEVLERTQHVMREVAAAQAADWPSDDDWRRRLPEWFLRSFEGHTLDELMSDPNLWDFGSWLDAMKAPGWEWWSSEVTEKEGNVRCVAHADPFGVEPLMYLLRSAGASEVEFEEEPG